MKYDEIGGQFDIFELLEEAGSDDSHMPVFSLPEKRAGIGKLEEAVEQYLRRGQLFSKITKQQEPEEADDGLPTFVEYAATHSRVCFRNAVETYGRAMMRILDAAEGETADQLLQKFIKKLAAPLNRIAYMSVLTPGGNWSEDACFFYKYRYVFCQTSTVDDSNNHFLLMGLSCIEGEMECRSEWNGMTVPHKKRFRRGGKSWLSRYPSHKVCLLDPSIFITYLSVIDAVIRRTKERAKELSDLTLPYPFLPDEQLDEAELRMRGDIFIQSAVQRIQRHLPYYRWYRDLLNGKLLKPVIQLAREFDIYDVKLMEKGEPVGSSIIFGLQEYVDALIQRRKEENKVREYNRQLAGTYALSFMTKKNIPQKTLEYMVKSSLNDHFGYIELDEQCDIAMVDKLAPEINTFIKRYFDGETYEKIALRFRRLGNHKASGLYYPGFQCICVSVMNVSSFVHEFGHMIDHTRGNLSMQSRFAAVKLEYLKVLNTMDSKAFPKGKYGKAYYEVPTEMFARSLEYYMVHREHFQCSIVGKANGLGYPTETDEGYKKACFRYFDTFFHKEKVEEREEAAV